MAAFFFGQSAVSWPSPHTNEIAGPAGLLAFAAAMFLSILIHELGHTFAFRHYGIQSHIVLYHFGGLAIPEGDQWGGYTAAARNPWHDLVVSAAGPLAQLLAVACGLDLINGTIPASRRILTCPTSSCTSPD